MNDPFRRSPGARGAPPDAHRLPHTETRPRRRPSYRDSAFTLIELVVVIIIASALMVLAGYSTGSFAYWRDEGFLRRVTETIEFLHYQAVSDQSFYKMEFDFDRGTYQVGVLKPMEENDEILSDLSADVGSLTLELTAFLNPSLGESQTFIPPPSFPSLSDRFAFPPGVSVKSMRTMRGFVTGEKGSEYLTFSPRGFSEFGVIHLTLSSGQEVTILVNPFTGKTTVYRGFKDFEWTYTGGDKK